MRLRRASRRAQCLSIESDTFFVFRCFFRLTSKQRNLSTKNPVVTFHRTLRCRSTTSLCAISKTKIENSWVRWIDGDDNDDGAVPWRRRVDRSRRSGRRAASTDLQSITTTSEVESNRQSTNVERIPVAVRGLTSMSMSCALVIPSPPANAANTQREQIESLHEKTNKSIYFRSTAYCERSADSCGAARRRRRRRRR